MRASLRHANSTAPQTPSGPVTPCNQDESLHTPTPLEQPMRAAPVNNFP